MKIKKMAKWIHKNYFIGNIILGFCFVIMGGLLLKSGVTFLTTILETYASFLTDKNVSEEFRYLMFITAVWVFLSMARFFIDTGVQVSQLSYKKKSKRGSV